MGFTRFVEVGRVAFIAFGPDKGKVCAIVDIVDQTRVLVDGPCSGVARQALNIKTIQLTNFNCSIPNSARTSTVKKAWEAGDLSTKWAESAWAKKLAAKEKRKTLSDFDRFKLMKAKQARNRLVAIEYGKLKRSSCGQFWRASL